MVNNVDENTSGRRMINSELMTTTSRIIDIILAIINFNKSDIINH